MFGSVCSVPTRIPNSFGHVMVGTIIFMFSNHDAATKILTEILKSEIEVSKSLSEIFISLIEFSISLIESFKSLIEKLKSLIEKLKSLTENWTMPAKPDSQPFNQRF
jgi:hypothetical protein